MKQRRESERAKKSQSSDAILKLQGIANRGEVGQSRSREDSESPCPVQEESIFISTVMIHDMGGNCSRNLEAPLTITRYEVTLRTKTSCNGRFDVKRRFKNEVIDMKRFSWSKRPSCYAVLGTISPTVT